MRLRFEAVVLRIVLVVWFIAEAMGGVPELIVTNAFVRTAGADEGPKPVSFVRDVRPILARACFACHGPDDSHREAELRLDTREGALAAHDGRRAVVPSNVAESVLITRILSDDATQKMPPPDSAKSLTVEQIETLKRWIAEGAAWGTHWSFEKPVRPELPAVKKVAWSKVDLDRFVLARIEREGLVPSPEADRQTLARRVAFDLTGLPPDPALVAKFVNDSAPNAYETLVDELLQSPAFGERWARMWLDIARYADTKGYEKDLMRTMWRYRDWLIDAYNRDLPFDQFTREQLAGDLLPNATTEQLLATAFHRNTMVNDEGGTDNEEFRIAAVKDRVDTTLQVWMGLTMGCAKCHSHKYDPISQRDYYQFLAYFNQTEDADDYDERPKLATPTREQSLRIEQLNAEVAKLEGQRDAVTPELKAATIEWEAKLKAARAWVVLKPQAFSTGGDSTMTLQEDGSMLVEAKSPASALYGLTFPVDLPRITGLKLEAIPDKSHPRGGVGRAVNDGNFVLSSITLHAAKSSGEITEIALTGAKADFSQGGYPVEDAIKQPSTKKNGWAVSPEQTRPHAAVFTPAVPYELPAGTALMVSLLHQFENGTPGFSLGRFRLSATSDDNPSLDAKVPESIMALVKLDEADRSPAQQAQLWTHVAGIAPLTQPLRDQMASLRKEIAAVPIPQTPILRELPEGKRRTTKLHVRGNFLEQSDVVEPAILPNFHPLAPDAPANRLSVAAWLTHPDNPLTARVAVNRVWSQFFGAGLVETQEDFGSQGQSPTHPELLDWLAVEFRQGSSADADLPAMSSQPWSHKRLCKLIVMSATYRQSSRASSDLLARDRFNRLLARGPRFRMEAEMIRDNALAVSGLLSRKMFGPSVMPPQPDGIWQSTYNTTKWETSQGEDRYRRGLYTFIKRTTPYPAMTTFDAPSRELCTVRRINTNTPLQALVTLNDPAYIEAAQALARRMVNEAASIKVEDRIAVGLQLALLRPARPNEITALTKLFDSRRTHYATHFDGAVQFATNPLGPLPAGQDAVDLAALTAVGNVILNLDEFVTRN